LTCELPLVTDQSLTPLYLVSHVILMGLHLSRKGICTCCNSVDNYTTMTESEVSILFCMLILSINLFYSFVFLILSLVPRLYHVIIYLNRALYIEDKLTIVLCLLLKFEFYTVNKYTVTFMLCEVL